MIAGAGRGDKWVAAHDGPSQARALPQRRWWTNERRDTKWENEAEKVYRGPDKEYLAALLAAIDAALRSPPGGTTCWERSENRS